MQNMERRRTWATRVVVTPTVRQGRKRRIEKAKEAKATLDTAIGQGKQFINEKKSALTAAFEAGKEAMKRERAS